MALTRDSNLNRLTLLWSEYEHGNAVLDGRRRDFAITAEPEQVARGEAVRFTVKREIEFAFDEVTDDISVRMAVGRQLPVGFECEADGSRCVAFKHNRVWCSLQPVEAYVFGLDRGFWFGCRHRCSSSIYDSVAIVSDTNMIGYWSLLLGLGVDGT